MNKIYKGIPLKTNPIKLVKFLDWLSCNIEVTTVFILYEINPDLESSYRCIVSFFLTPVCLLEIPDPVINCCSSERIYWPSLTQNDPNIQKEKWNIQTSTEVKVGTRIFNAGMKMLGWAGWHAISLDINAIAC